MRLVFVVLLIALLPLRGWAGHVMAVNLASQQIKAAQKVDVTQAGKGALTAMPADCPMSAQAGNEYQAGAIACYNCDTCELCLALASANETCLQAAFLMPQPMPLAVHAGFRSADRASDLKPPIF